MKGVASFHGGLRPLPSNFSGNVQDIQPKILIMTGHDDPSIPPDMVKFATLFGKGFEYYIKRKECRSKELFRVKLGTIFSVGQ